MTPERIKEIRSFAHPQEEDEKIIEECLVEIERLQKLVGDIFTDNICTKCEYHGKEAFKKVLEGGIK